MKSLERIGNAFLPVAQDLETVVRAIPDIMGLYIADTAYLTLNGSNRMTAWASAIDGQPAWAALSGHEPLFSLNNNDGLGQLDFVHTRPDAAQWAGTLPTGVGAKHTALMVASLGDSTGRTSYLLSYQPSATDDGRHNFVQSTANATRISIDQASGGEAISLQNVNAASLIGVPALYGYSHDQTSGTASNLVNNVYTTQINALSQVGDGRLYLGTPGGLTVGASTSPTMTLRAIIIVEDELIQNDDRIDDLNLLKEYFTARYLLDVWRDPVIYP